MYVPAVALFVPESVRYAVDCVSVSTYVPLPVVSVSVRVEFADTPDSVQAYDAPLPVWLRV